MTDSGGRLTTRAFAIVAVLSVVAAAVLAFPDNGAWAAGVRYADAQGSGSACTLAAPCGVEEALAGSVTGDSVVLLSDEGPYGSTGTPLATTLTVPGGVALEGALEESRPILNSAASAGLQVGSGASVTGVDLHYTGAGPALEVGDEANVSRTLVRSTASAPACELDAGATVANTVCAGMIAMRASAAPATAVTVTLRNDTLVGAQRGLEVLAGNGATETVEVHNSIVRGGARDVVAERSGTGTASVQLATSNFATVEALAGTTIAAPGSGGSQTAAPHFVDAAGGDFQELGDSPTIDAGENDPANGDVDLLGDPRVRPGHLNCEPPPPAITDVGAYELNPIAPPCAPRVSATPWIPPRGTLVRVPRVRGLSLRGAVGRLHRRGLRVSVGGRRPRCRPGARRRVTSQTPGAMKLVPPGSRVLVLTECRMPRRG